MEAGFFDKDIRFLKGVGEKRAQAFYRLGVHSPGALLRFYPRAYLDLSDIKRASDAVSGETCAIKVIVAKKQPEARIRKGFSIFKINAFDESGMITVVFYNNKYAADALKVGQEYILYGKITANLFGREISSPQIFPPNMDCELSPIYPATASLSSKMIEKSVSEVFRSIDNFICEDPLPQSIRQKYNLCEYNYALSQIHKPKTKESLRLARERLSFEELFYLQLGLLKIKEKAHNKTDVVLKNTDCLDEFLKSLSFSPTAAQIRSAKEALSDMSSGKQMNRLLQGDVGSGKTLVAAMLSFVSAKNGYQSAIMAPTEILATQHYESLSKMFSQFGISVALLTGSMKAKEKATIKEQIKSGETDVVIGTHAILEDDAVFKNLGFIVTDEQHRFGVAQRKKLTEKATGVHTLVMSATPIPRTLALVIYSDLDLSVLDEMPKGRTPIKTYKIDSAKREKAHGYIKEHCQNGSQAYIICPLIEEGETDLLSATEYAEIVKKGPLKDVPTAVLHGKMKAQEKDEIMEKFRLGEIKVLISTTVVEVGVDVKDATVILIENAERFGLSQLHQLRGRVGRGDKPSHCILLSDHKNEETQKRLQVMCSTTDGFKISEEDLKSRGPGDFFGNRQHGLPEMKLGGLAGDMRIVKNAREAAALLLESDPDLSLSENKIVRESVSKMFSQTGGILL